MAAEHDNYVPIKPLNHIGALTSISDHSNKKEQQQGRRKKKRKQIDAQLSEERSKEDEQDENINDDHIDFHA